MLNEFFTLPSHALCLTVMLFIGLMKGGSHENNEQPKEKAFCTENRNF